MHDGYFVDATDMVPTRRSIHPIPKPTPDVVVFAQQLAMAEQVRQAKAEMDRLHDQLLDAVGKGWATTAHHALNRMLALRDECQGLEMAG